MQCPTPRTLPQHHPHRPCPAAARRLKAVEGQLRGTVRLLFQPAEEGKGGAKVMIEEGALDGVSAVFGLHVLPFLPTGAVQLRVRAKGWWRALRSERGIANGGLGRPGQPCEAPDAQG